MLQKYTEMWGGKVFALSACGNHHSKLHRIELSFICMSDLISFQFCSQYSCFILYLFIGKLPNGGFSKEIKLVTTVKMTVPCANIIIA